MPSAAITQLLRSPQFGGAPSAPVPAARSTATPPAKPALPRPQMAPVAPPTASPAPDIAALLAMLGLGPPRQVEPPTPVAPVPRQPSRSREAEDLIGKALQDPMSNERPLFLSADQLDELDIDTEDLAISLAHLQLHAAENFDAQGGVLVARSRNLLEAAERLKRGFRPVPFVPVMPARRESG
jgi:hypothetical protein